MLTINKLLPQGRGLSDVLRKRASSIELDGDTRSKSRFDATDSTRHALAVFLPRGTVVRGGDVLVAEDGSLRRVVAALPRQMDLIVEEATAPFEPEADAYAAGGHGHAATHSHPDVQDHSH